MTQNLHVKPTAARLPLLLGASQIGSVEIELGQRLLSAGLLGSKGNFFTLEGDPDAQLAHIAAWLHSHQLSDAWRDELLSVVDDEGEKMAVVERAAVRLLGIKTFAVHLVGRTIDGKYWLQCRAKHKAVDPGLWDTLVGGLVSAGEDFFTALARETNEEAGLMIQQLTPTGREGVLDICQPLSPGFHRYMVEDVYWYEYQIPEQVMPNNQDGEVSDFKVCSPDELVELIAQGKVTSISSRIFMHLLMQDHMSAC